MEKERSTNHGSIPERTGSRLVYFAAERTLLSWMRAALGLMIFGFVVDRFGLFLRHYSPDDLARVYPEAYTLWLGVILVVTGVIMIAVATVRYFGFIIHYRREASTDPGHGLSWGVAFTLLVTLVASAIVMYLVAMTK